MVEESAELNSSPGNFGGKIQGGKLLLPNDVYTFFDEAQATDDAGILIATHQHFPSYKNLLAKHLGWKEEEVQKAYENLVDLVRDHVPERYLNWKPPQYEMGARNPTELKKKGKK